MSDKKELSIMEKLAEPLTNDDIEARIGNCFSKGFSILLYKTARTDINRLNSVFGLQWQNKHFYDINKNLCCEISVFDKETSQWVSRVDVGTESNTEREKGSYSDSFKRAGTRFGIGIELYNSPFIFVTWEMEKDQKSDKFKPKDFYASNMEITKYKAINHQITELEIIYKGKVIYSYGSKQQPEEKTMNETKSGLHGSATNEEYFERTKAAIMEATLEELKSDHTDTKSFYGRCVKSINYLMKHNGNELAKCLEEMIKSRVAYLEDEAAIKG